MSTTKAARSYRTGNPLAVAQAGRRQTLPLKPLPLKVVYHTPCHMEKWAGRSTPWSCCVKSRGLSYGAGFPVLRYCGYLRFQKREHPTSQAIGAPLFRQIEESGAIWSSPTAKPANGRLRCPRALLRTSDYATGPGAGLTDLLMPVSTLLIGHFCERDSTHHVCLQRFENSSENVSQRLKLTDVKARDRRNVASS